MEESKQYTLADGTVIWQGPLKLGQILEIAKRLGSLDLNGILEGEKMAELLSILLEPKEIIQGMNLMEVITADMALEMIQDFFVLNPRTAQLLSGLSSAIPVWFAHWMSRESISTESKVSNGSSTPFAEETLAGENG